MILRLVWSIERTCNGFWHLIWAARFQEYSPGLLTSILFWMELYFVLRYRPPSEPLGPCSSLARACDRARGNRVFVHLHSCLQRERKAGQILTYIRRKTIAGLKQGDSSLFRAHLRNRIRPLLRISVETITLCIFDHRFAHAKNFHGKICHGLLVAGILTEIGGHIGWLASEMNFRVFW